MLQRSGRRRGGGAALAMVAAPAGTGRCWRLVCCQQWSTSSLHVCETSTELRRLRDCSRSLCARARTCSSPPSATSRRRTLSDCLKAWGRALSTLQARASQATQKPGGPHCAGARKTRCALAMQQSDTHLGGSQGAGPSSLARTSGTGGSGPADPAAAATLHALQLQLAFDRLVGVIVPGEWWHTPGRRPAACPPLGHACALSWAVPFWYYQPVAALAQARMCPLLQRSTCPTCGASSRSCPQRTTCSGCRWWGRLRWPTCSGPPCPAAHTAAGAHPCWPRCGCGRLPCR